MKPILGEEQFVEPGCPAQALRESSRRHSSFPQRDKKTLQCWKERRRSTVADTKPGGSGVEGVLREQMGIRGIDVLRAVQVQSPGPLGTEAEFPRARDFALDGDICWFA